MLQLRPFGEQDLARRPPRAVRAVRRGHGHGLRSRSRVGCRSEGRVRLPAFPHAAPAARGNGGRPRRPAAAAALPAASSERARPDHPFARPVAAARARAAGRGVADLHRSRRPRSRRTSPTVMAASASDGKRRTETHAVAGAPCEGIAARASRRQPRAGRRGERMRAVSQLFREGVSSDDRLPPHRWLIVQRVERAKEWMRNPSLPLSMIADACGFADQSHFSRTFTRLTGVSPRRWRADHT